MKIQLKLMGVLKDKTPEGDAIDLPDGATIDQALAVMEIQADRIQVITINSSIERDRGRVLVEGDELSVIPPVGGG